MKATLHLVSACPMPAVSMGPGMALVPDHAEVVESAKGDLEKIAADLRSQGLSVEVHTPIGDAADGLCSVAETVGADLIVVGNKRMHGVARGRSAACPTGWRTRRPAASSSRGPPERGSPLPGGGSRGAIRP